jgi:hypothetical protein
MATLESTESSVQEVVPEILLEGKLLKLSRKKVWQERHFVFTDEHILSYTHEKEDCLEPNACFRITRDSGCEISDLYVEQRLKGAKKESLYCITFTWGKEEHSEFSFLNDSSHDFYLTDDLSMPLTPPQGDPKSVGSNDGSRSELSGFNQKFSPVSRVKRRLKGKKGVRHVRRSSFDSSGDDASISSIGTPNLGRSRSSKTKKKSDIQKVPTIVKMDTDHQKFPEYETIVESPEGEKSPASTSKPAQPGNKNSNPEPTESNGTKNRQQRHATEQEMLHGQFFDKEKRKSKNVQRKLIEGTKIMAATSAAVGFGVLTAGVGLAAGLVVLGAAAAAGGTAGVAEVGLKKLKKSKSILTVASANYDVAKLWKSSIDAYLESESVKTSTWGQKYVAEGRKTTAALVPKHNELMTAVLNDDTKTPRSLPAGQTSIFLRDGNFLGDSAQWRPLEGGWTSLFGPGAQSLRIFREQKVEIPKKSKKIFRLAVGGASTSAPLKAQVILNVHPLDAFMCLMSYSRLDSTEIESSANGLTPKSGHSASFRVLDKIDDHTDIVHLFCRKLYLFPSWTEPRDFVLFRYWRYEPDGSYFVCYESVEHPACPPQPGFVRGEMHQVWTLAPAKKSLGRRKGQTSNGPECMLTSVVQVGPRGWVPTKPIPFLSNQTYTDAFGIAALLQMLDIRDAIENDRFLDVAPDLTVPKPSLRSGDKSTTGGATNEQINYDLRYADRERANSLIGFDAETFCGLESNPPSLNATKWAEPDANSFLVRGPSYLRSRKKINAGVSVGRLVAVDLVNVDQPIFTGMSTHPTERIQLALAKERAQKEAGKPSDMPPFVFVVNICLPGPPYYHAVFYYAVDDMSTIDGSDGTGSSLLCKEFLFGESDHFRDKTFKLIPQIVEGNFMVRKAVGSTPAIMGTKLAQYYARSDRFMEVILDCGSSQVATGVIRLSLGYAKMLMVDMGFLLEGGQEDFLPERIVGCVRMKFPEFGPEFVRKVEDPSKLG